MSILTLDDRAVLRVAGADAIPFLQGLLTNDLALLAPGRPLYAGLLSPQGKTLFALNLFHEADDAVLIDVAASQAESLARRLALYRLRKAVTIAAAPELAVFATIGSPWPGQPADPRCAALGARWIAARDAGIAADPEAWHAHRLALGIAEAEALGVDELLWLETGADLLNGVSFTKGCYVGQENTARMHHRDRVRRRLVPVRLSGPAGEGVLVDEPGRVVGQLRGAPAGDVAIAHLRLEAAAAPILVDGRPVVVLRPAWLAAALAAAEVA